MKNINKWLVVLLMCFSMNVYAKGFGGGRSSSSSFGGSRSSGVSMNRPSYSRPSYSAPSSTHTTVVEHHYSSGGGSGNGLLTGMMIGHMMSNNGPTVIQGGMAQAPIPESSFYANGQVPQQQSTGWSTWWIFLLLVLGIGGCFWAYNKGQSCND